MSAAQHAFRRRATKAGGLEAVCGTQLELIERKGSLNIPRGERETEMNFRFSCGPSKMNNPPSMSTQGDPSKENRLQGLGASPLPTGGAPRLGVT